MSKFSIFISLLFCLSATSAFANDVTAKLCIKGDPRLSGIHDTFDYLKPESFIFVPPSIGTYSLGGNNCIQKKLHFQKNRNKLYFVFSLFNEMVDGFAPDSSCKTGVFSFGERYIGDLSLSDHRTLVGYCIKVDNGLGKRVTTDWGVDFDMKAELGKPVKISCKYIQY